MGYYVKKFSRKNPRDDRQNVTRPSKGRNKFKGFAIETRELILTSAIEMFSQKKYRELKDLVEAYYALKRLESEAFREKQEMIKRTDTTNAL